MRSLSLADLLKILLISLGLIVVPVICFSVLNLSSRFGYQRTTVAFVVMGVLLLILIVGSGKAFRSVGALSFSMPPGLFMRIGLKATLTLGCFVALTVVVGESIFMSHYNEAVSNLDR